jgi:hypothetical protein
MNSMRVSWQNLYCDFLSTAWFRCDLSFVTISGKLTDFVREKLVMAL